MDKYYIVMTEWLMPTEGGREFIEEYDTWEEANERALEEVQSEIHSDGFFGECKGNDKECWQVNSQTDKGKKIGWMIDEANGLSNWFFFARIIEVPKFEYHGKEI